MLRVGICYEYVVLVIFCFLMSLQDYLGAVIVLAAAAASIWSFHYGLHPGGLVGLGLTYALTVRFLFYVQLLSFFTLYSVSELPSIRS